jgi:hypothetical protein
MPIPDEIVFGRGERYISFVQAAACVQDFTIMHSADGNREASSFQGTRQCKSRVCVLASHYCRIVVPTSVSQSRGTSGDTGTVTPVHLCVRC